MLKRIAQRRIRNRCRNLRSLFAEGNEKADELAKAGTMLDGCFMVQARASTIQQEREEVHAALQYAASLNCLVEEWKDCEELKQKAKENGFTWIRKERKRSVERSGVP